MLSPSRKINQYSPVYHSHPSGQNCLLELRVSNHLAHLPDGSEMVLLRYPNSWRISIGIYPENYRHTQVASRLASNEEVVVDSLQEWSLRMMLTSL